MNKEIQDFYITHLIPDLLPQKGLRKLLFYTSNKQNYNKGLYFWGLDSKKTFTEKQMLNFEKAGMVVKVVPSPFEAKRGMGLWLDANGIVYCASLENPHDDLKKAQKFAPKHLSKAAQIYQKSIADLGLPTPLTVVEF